jgi:hypothetical protein
VAGPFIAVSIRAIIAAATAVAAAAVSVTVGLSTAAMAVLARGRSAWNYHRGHNQRQRRPTQHDP